MTEQKFGLSGFALKWIAMLSMLADHTGAVLFPQYIQLRMIGRIAFPIYCFLLAEGAVHTRNIRKYEMRLLLFALMSEIPFDLAFSSGMNFRHQNVFFTLFLGLVVVEQYQKNRDKLSSFLIFVIVMLLAEFLNTDYGAAGVVFILIFYLLYQYTLGKQAAFAAANFLMYQGGIQAYAGFAVIPMLLYNGKRGPSMKYLFYAFYPLHLLAIYFICKIMY
ncbi:hypothetical protein E5329_07635 [Petralouisia muris]|jgi:hypothetical protein|uniref:Uncharacterized protein n=1 Tax=Petralouisia muris TaxID=3032872 RepID=A0AC61RY09_9FIRM|nr:TraX family protein [Petralouisia muris]TGY96857.1 hypothetical protein E5329_07635 [Petralouisia muris]